MRCAIRTVPLVLGFLLTACSFGNIFQQSQPTLSNVNGATTPTGAVGSEVILAGAGFGDTQGAGRVLFQPIAGGAVLTPTVVSWTAAAIVITAPVAAAGDYAISVQSGNGIVSSSRVFTLTPVQTFTPSAGTWSAGPTLPGAVSGAGVAFADIGTSAYVYVVGGAGAGGVPVSTVSFAQVASNGTLGAWTATTALPTALAFPGVTAATIRNSAVLGNGYLYAFGGATSATGTPVSTAYRAAITVDGTLGPWVTVTPLPAALYSVGAVVQYGSMYVIGGAGSSNAPVMTTYRLPIQVDGGLIAPWKAQGSLPAARARFGVGVSGLYLYAVGGDGSAIAPNDTGPSSSQSTVYFAKLNPSTRDIATAWTPTTALGHARAATTAVFGPGNVLVTGGLYAGDLTHTSESEYATVNADGTTGTFTTAAPATSINTLCSCNLFNHGSTGYHGSNGTFHVLVAGGDNANAPGTRRAETFIF